MNEYEYKFQKDIHEHIVNHVFLPRRLPSFQTAKETETHELHIMDLMKSIVGISEMELPFSMLKLMKVLHNSTSFHFHLTRLKPGEMIGFHADKQNCAILVYRPSGNSNEVLVSTIQSSLQSIYEEGGGDIQVKIGLYNFLNSFRERLLVSESRVDIMIDNKKFLQRLIVNVVTLVNCYEI